MRLEALSVRERRIIALGFLLVVVLALVFAVGKPVADRYWHYQNAIEDLSFRLERLASVAATGPALSEQVASLTEAVRSAGLTVERATPALAAADMQLRLGELVSEKGGEVQSTQVVPPVAEEGFVRVAVRVQMRGDSAALAGVFEAVESARPLVFIDNVRVQDRRGARGRGSEALSEEVDVQFDAVVFMRAPEPPSP